MLSSLQIENVAVIQKANVHFEKASIRHSVAVCIHRGILFHIYRPSSHIRCLINKSQHTAVTS